MRSREAVSISRTLRKAGQRQLAIKVVAETLKARLKTWKHSRRHKQVELTGELQDLLLEDFVRMLREGTMTPTDRATLFRLLSSNGWNLDPQSLPQGLKGVLKLAVDPKDLDDEDAA